MSKLSSIAEEIRYVKEILNAPPVEDFRVKAGHDMRRAEARQRLDPLNKQYQEVFKTVGFPVFVTGPGATNYVNTAKQLTPSVVVDYSTIFRDVRQTVAATMGNNREFGPNQYTALIRELRQVAVNGGVNSFPVPSFEGNVYVGDDSKQLDAVVNKYIEKATGTALSGPAIEAMAAKDSLNFETESPIVPVLIVGTDLETAEKVGPSVFGKKYTFVEAPADLDEDFVVNTLKTVQKLVKEN